MSDLVGKFIAVSIGDASDRARLGLPAREVDRALYSICMALVRAGAKIVYGGNLDPSGFTFKIFRHLASAYNSTETAPFVHIVPEPIIRTASFIDLAKTLRESQRVVDARISMGGELVEIRSVSKGIRIGSPGYQKVITDEKQFDAWMSTLPQNEDGEALSTARSVMNDLMDARVILGGKMGVLDNPADTYQGKMPGIIEEAILSLEAGKPLVPLGAFGGAARDVAIALGILGEAGKVPRGPQSESYYDAITTVRQLQGSIPALLRPRLEALAIDDRSEPLAFDLKALLIDWLELRKTG